ncbi:MAG TPA: hypothetical protein VJ598_04540, partial [Albitalea sp.]|nr:hypothetical protein [Albitalea sp.]
MASLIACCATLAACGGGAPDAAPAPPAAATVAPEATTTISDVPWGVAPSATLARAPETWAPLMLQAGVAAVRNFDTATTTADHLKPLTDAGMSVSGILQWSSASPASLPVNDLAGWRRYVSDTVTRFKGRVTHWEVWNEPPNGTADKSVLSYAAVVAVAYDAAKAVDPNVQIGLAAKSNHVNWLAQAIDAGAANKFDFITLHPYENAGLLAQGWEGQFMSIAPRVRTMLQDKNPTKAGVPLWFSEIGLQVSPPATSGVSPEVQADALVKIYTMALAQGVARVYWFSPRDSEGMSFGLSATDGTPRASYAALRSLASTLGARPSFLGWVQPGGAHYGFVFGTAQTTVLAAWARTGQTSTLNFASPVTVIDPRSGATRSATTLPLTDVPVLLVAPAASAQAQQWQRDAAASVGKAFPWYGDHRNAASVSLTAGSDPQGVFMVNAPAASVVNGIAEFDLEGRSGAKFTVDPSFL